MHDELDTLGYQLMLQTETTDSATVAERLIANALDGVVLATTTVDSVVPVRLRDRGVPFVYFNRTSATIEADSATVDPGPGLSETAERVAALGHRRVGAIFGPRNTSTGAERETALREALGGVGITIGQQYVHRGAFDFDTGYAGGQLLLRRTPPPTVIICGNDVVAMGTLNAARELGVSVPADVSIVGFDDLPQAAWPLIQLTTVAFDLDGMARTAAGLLVKRTESRSEAGFEHAVFPSRLIERASLGRPPAA